MSTSFKSIQSVIAFVLVLLNSFLMLREEYTGEECGKCDENEHNPFVLVLPLLTSAKKMRVFLLVFAFVRKIVRARVALALVKEVITEREERFFQFPR